MGINTDLVGHQFDPFVREYTFKDLELCALGCNAGFDGKTDLIYLNEHDAHDPHLKVLPAFAIPFTVNQEVARTLDCGVDYAHSMHYAFDLELHSAFSMNDHVETYVTLAGVYDRGEGRGSLEEHVGESYRSDGTHLCTLTSQIVGLADGGWGGPKPPKDVVEIPDRAPDAVVEETLPLNLPLIYRLMGDWHQQHINWDYTAQTGLPRPIVHGVSIAGIGARHLVSTWFEGKPERMRRFKGRFTCSAVPGTRIATRMWKMSDGEVHFQVADADVEKIGTKPYLNAGVCQWE